MGVDSCRRWSPLDILMEFQSRSSARAKRRGWALGRQEGAKAPRHPGRKAIRARVRYLDKFWSASIAVFNSTIKDRIGVS
jgi:hypothetical protein